MAELSGLPVWVRTAKRKIQKSDEWLNFSKALFDQVNSYMNESGVSSFGSLSSNEKQVLVSEAATSLKHEDVFRNLSVAISESLDVQFSEEVNKGSHRERGESQTDLISEEFYRAIEALLTRLSDARASFAVCLNAILPPKLRYLMWAKQLQSPAISREYMQVAQKSPKKLVSKFDLEIAHKCQALLDCDVTLRPLRDIAAGVSVLRHTLSYHHVRSKSGVALSDTEYLVAVPFVYCTLVNFIDTESSIKQNSITPEALARLTEQFQLFWNSRAPYSRLPNDGVGLKSFAEIVTIALKRIDADLLQAIADVFTSSKLSPTSSAGHAVATLLGPCLRCFFVSYLPLESVMFIFDQIVIGFGVTGYDPLPLLSAAIIFLAGIGLKQSKSWREAETRFREAMAKMSVKSIQRVISEKMMLDEWRTAIEKVHCAPISLTSFNKLPPWRQWYSDKLQARLTSDMNKEVAVDRKESGMSNALPRGTKGTKGGEDVVEDNELKAELDHLVDEVHSLKEDLEKARGEIAELRKQKVEVEMRADAEVDRLQTKLSYLQRPDRLTPPLLVTRASLLGLTEPEYEDSESSSLADAVPPPSPATQFSEPLKVSPSALSIREVEDKQPSVNTPILEDVQPPTSSVDVGVVFSDVILRMMEGVQTLAHGSDDERMKLDKETRLDLATIRKAHEEARNVIIGSSPDGELEKLPENQRRGIESRLHRATRSRLIAMKFGQK